MAWQSGMVNARRRLSPTSSPLFSLLKLYRVSSYIRNGSCLYEICVSCAMRNWPKQAANLRNSSLSSDFTMYCLAGNRSMYAARLGWLRSYMTGVSTSMPPYSMTFCVTPRSSRDFTSRPFGGHRKLPGSLPSS